MVLIPLLSRLLTILVRFSIFFFLMRRHPPTSTLFPYTTLFRSARRPDDDGGAARGVAVGGRHHRRSIGGAAGARAQAALLGSPRAERAALCRRARGPSSRGRRRDRKSTRLNSSHVSISYAVFCL